MILGMQFIPGDSPPANQDPISIAVKLNSMTKSDITDLSILPIVAYASLSNTPVTIKSDGIALNDPISTSTQCGYIFNQSEYAVVASLANYENALCSVPLASSLRCPLVLADEKLTDDQIKMLEDLGVKSVYLVGDIELGVDLEVIKLPTYKEIAQEILSLHPVDYIVLTNPDDWARINQPFEFDVPKTSLAAPQLACYRNGIIIPVRPSIVGLGELSIGSPSLLMLLNLQLPPKYISMEIKVRDDLAELGIVPSYIGIVGGPSAIPFKETATSWYQQMVDVFNDDMTDDCELFTNAESANLLDPDPFIDVAVGRLTGNDVGDAFRLEYYSMIRERKAPPRIRYFAHGQLTDIILVNAEIWSKLLAMEQSSAGFDVKTFYGTDATVDVLNEELEGYDGAVLIGAHGNPATMALSDAEADGVLKPNTLNTKMDGAVMFSLSCSVANGIVTSPLSSYNEALEGSLIHAFIDQGISSYIGSTEIATSPDSDMLTLNAFLGVVREGKPVGVALQDAKNQLLQEQLLPGTAVRKIVAGLDTRERFARFGGMPSIGNSFIRDGTGMYARTVSTHILIGDPAFRPYTGYESNGVVHSIDGSYIQISVPEDFYIVEATAEKMTIRDRVEELGTKLIIEILQESLVQLMYPNKQLLAAPFGIIPYYPIEHWAPPIITADQSPSWTAPGYLVKVPLEEGCNRVTIVGDYTPPVSIEQTPNGPVAWFTIPIRPDMAGEIIILQILPS